MTGLGDETGLRGLAEKLGLTAVGSTTSAEYQDEIGSLPEVPLLRGVEPDEVIDVMIGRLYETNAQVFNVVRREYREDPTHPRRSCVALMFLGDFPTLTIGPHTPMSRLRARAEWQSFRGISPTFRNRFDLRSDDPDAAELLLSREMLTFLDHQPEGLRVEIASGVILGHVPTGGEAEILELVETVHGIHSRIPHQAWTKFSLFGNL